MDTVYGMVLVKCVRSIHVWSVWGAWGETNPPPNTPPTHPPTSTPRHPPCLDWRVDRRALQVASEALVLDAREVAVPPHERLGPLELARVRDRLRVLVGCVCVSRQWEGVVVRAAGHHHRFNTPPLSPLPRPQYDIYTQ